MENGREELQGTVKKELMVSQIRSAARQFAMLCFHFCKTLVDCFGAAEAEDLVRKTVFELAVDRTDKMRIAAEQQGVSTITLEGFNTVTDLPYHGWIAEWGAAHCPYAETWRPYCKEYPWFQKFALLYCDVIDTTTIENFTKHLSHRITQNVVASGESCERIYFESEKVKNGGFTYREEGEK